MSLNPNSILDFLFYVTMFSLRTPRYAMNKSATIADSEDMSDN